MRAVFVNNLRAGMEVARDIYASDDSLVPLIKAHTILTPELIDELAHRRISFIYALDSDMPESPILAKLPRVQRRKPILSPQLQNTALKGLSEAFAVALIEESDIHESSKAIMTHLDNIVESLVSTLQTDEYAVVSINDLKSFDDYTFHHSLSVAVLSIAIAQKIGFDYTRIREVGLCAMMHDIGKTFVPIHIINKPSRLDDSEFSIIKTHARAGFDFLTKSGLNGDEILRGILHHHEKIDGSGYPDGLKGEEIPIYSRIITIADVYDALTSSRPYRTPMQPSDAMEFIMGGVQTAFDYDLVNAFMNKIELYPVGTLVELSNGMIGIVLNNENQLRPVIQTTSGDLFDLGRDSKFLNIVISRTLPDNFSKPGNNIVN